MNIYSYYYGASAGSGIGIRALSPQLENHPVLSDLKDLSSLHALEATGRDSEMLSYLLQRNGFGILGLSYIEPAKSSGYGRSAPCGLQYVVPEEEMKGMGAELGGIVNFIDFQKPSSSSPAPRDKFPLNESGYSFHNSVSVLKLLVDGLVRVALSGQKEVLLVALPKGKNSEYATARYTIAEALNYLPVAARQKIRFFTGLPVGEGVTDPLVGFDNAVKYNANVIFCPSEYYEKLRGYRTFIGLDMERPSGRAGAFAEYVTRTLTPSEAISQTVSLIPGETYNSLNQAAQKLQSGEVVPLVDQLKAELENSKKRCGDYEQQLDRKNQEIAALQREMQKSAFNRQQYVPQEEDDDEDDSDEPRGRGVLSRILLVCVVILLMALTGLASWLIATKVHTGSFFPKKETAVIAAVPTASPEANLQDNQVTAEDQNGTAEPETNPDEKPAETDTEPAETGASTTEQSEASGSQEGDSSLGSATNDSQNAAEDQHGAAEAATNLDEKTEETNTEPAETVAPTTVPTDVPTAEPTEEPTTVPTEEPTAVPTDVPTAVPTEEPTAVPTDAPTAVPTETPTAVPAEAPVAKQPGAQDGQEDKNFVVSEEETVPENTITEGTGSGLGVNNRYGVINANRVNFRSAKVLKSENVITQFNKGKYTWMMKTEKDEAGEQWTEVYADGQFGYIVTKYLDMLSQEESNQYDAAQSTPVPDEMYAKNEIR